MKNREFIVDDTIKPPTVISYGINLDREFCDNFLPDSPHCLLQEIHTHSRQHYFAKIDKNNQMFNPFIKENAGRDRKLFGENTWQMKRINRAAFVHYKLFLETRKTIHLRLAEREIYG